MENSTLLEGDAADAVAGLKQQPGKDLTVLGSGELVRSLRRRDLIDEYLLLIHPLVLGSGRRLFPDGGPAGHAAAGRRHADDHRRGDRDLPAGRPVTSTTRRSAPMTQYLLSIYQPDGPAPPPEVAGADHAATSTP